jgi:hypothetical protein
MVQQKSVDVVEEKSKEKKEGYMEPSFKCITIWYKNNTQPKQSK